MNRLLAGFEEPLVPTMWVTLMWLATAATLEEALIQLAHHAIPATVNA